MSSVFKIYYEDALDHSNEAYSFDTYEEAKEAWEKCVKDGPEDYEIGVELLFAPLDAGAPPKNSLVVGRSCCLSRC